MYALDLVIWVIRGHFNVQTAANRGLHTLCTSSYVTKTRINTVSQQKDKHTNMMSIKSILTTNSVHKEVGNELCTWLIV